MLKVIEREEMIKKYATNEFEEDYIYNLGNEVFEQVAEVIGYLEDTHEEVTFHDILEHSLVICIHTYDFITENTLKSRFPNAAYTMLHYTASGSDYSIRQDENEATIIKISMSDEHYIIMSLLDTLDDLKNYIYEQGVATNVIITNNEDGKEY